MERLSQDLAGIRRLPLNYTKESSLNVMVMFVENAS